MLGDNLVSLSRRYFSGPQYGEGACDRIVCPMKSAIRRYSRDVFSAKDISTALSNVLFEAQLPAFA